MKRFGIPAGIVDRMTDEPSKPEPKRKRRRWLIAAILLFVVVTVWWNWRRGDERFVGKWQASTRGVQSVITFPANGMAVTEVDEQKFTYPWRVADGRLFYGWKVNRVTLPPARLLADLWRIVAGRTPVVGEDSLELEEVAGDVIRVRRPDSVPADAADESQSWTRVPD